MASIMLATHSCFNPQNIEIKTIPLDREVLSRDKESGSFAGRHISPPLLAQYFGEKLVGICRVC